MTLTSAISVRSLQNSMNVTLETIAQLVLSSPSRARLELLAVQQD